MSESKALVLLSGGLDSTTALAWAVDTYGQNNVKALIMDYGQKHDRELVCAHNVAYHYGVECKRITLPRKIWAESQCTLLKGRPDIEESTYAEQIAEAQKAGKPMIDTSIPFRNGVFLSIAVAVASSWGCQNVIIAAHQDDSGAAYPDCSPTFLDNMAMSIYYGTGRSVYLECPWGNLTKDQIVKWGLAHSVPYEKTWSCYKGGEKACGVCATCRDRLKAFELNDAIDPIMYEERK